MTRFHATRRRVLSLIGATPIAAKAAADDALAKVMGLAEVNGLGDNQVWLGGMPESGEVGGATGAQLPYKDRITRAARYLRVTGVPDWLKEDLREQSQWVSSLDPDLACKRSWSMSVKIAEQRQRNYRRRLDEMQKQAMRMDNYDFLKKALGFDWPW